MLAAAKARENFDFARGDGDLSPIDRKALSS